MYSLIALSMFTLCYYRHHLSTKLSCCKTESLYPSNNDSPLLLPPGPWTIIPLSISMNFTIRGISYVWNHAVLAFLCVVYFTQHSVLQVHVCRSLGQNGLSFQGRTTPHWVILLTTLISWWTPGLLSPLGYCKCCCYKCGCINTSLSPCF